MLVNTTENKVMIEDYVKTQHLNFKRSLTNWIFSKGEGVDTDIFVNPITSFNPIKGTDNKDYTPLKKGDKNYNVNIFTEQGKDIMGGKNVCKSYCIREEDINGFCEKITLEIRQGNHLNSSLCIQQPEYNKATPLFIDYDFSSGGYNKFQIEDENGEVYNYKKYIKLILNKVLSLVSEKYSTTPSNLAGYAFADEHHKELGFWIVINKNVYDKERCEIVKELVEYEKGFKLLFEWEGGIDTSVVRNYPSSKGIRHRGNGQMFNLMPKAYIKPKHRYIKRGMKLCIHAINDERFSGEVKQITKALFQDKKRDRKITAEEYDATLAFNIDLMNEVYFRNNELETLGEYVELKSKEKTKNNKEHKILSLNELVDNEWFSARLVLIKKNYPELLEILEMGHLKVDIDEKRYAIRIPDSIEKCPIFKKKTLKSKDSNKKIMAYLNILRDESNTFKYHHINEGETKTFYIDTEATLSSPVFTKKGIYESVSESERCVAIEKLFRSFKTGKVFATQDLLTDMLMVSYPYLRYCGEQNKKNNVWYDFNEKTNIWYRCDSDYMTGKVKLWWKQNAFATMIVQETQLKVFKSQITETDEDKIKELIEDFELIQYKFIEHILKMTQEKFKELAPLFKIKAKAQTPADFRERLNGNRDIIAFRNGCLDFRNEIDDEGNWKKPPFRKYDASDMVMTFLDYDYEGIWSEGNTTPRKVAKCEEDDLVLLDGWVKKMFYHDVELQEYWKFVLGYAITGHTNLKFMVILQGTEGNNGKSTITNILEYILGNMIRELNALVFTSKDTNATTPYLSAWRDGALITYIEELPKQSNPQIIKQRVGLLDTHALYRRFNQDTEERCIYKSFIIVFTNELFECGTSESAISNRIRPMVVKSSYKTIHQLQYEEQMGSFEEGEKHGLFKLDEAYPLKFQHDSMRSSFMDWIYPHSVEAVVKGEPPLPKSISLQRDRLLTRTSQVDNYIKNSLRRGKQSGRCWDKITKKEFSEKWGRYIQKVLNLSSFSVEGRAVKKAYRTANFMEICEKKLAIKFRGSKYMKEGKRTIGGIPERTEMMYGVKWIDTPDKKYTMKDIKTGENLWETDDNGVILLDKNGRRVPITIGGWNTKDEEHNGNESESDSD